jgi:hypothetical protein
VFCVLGVLFLRRVLTGDPVSGIGFLEKREPGNRFSVPGEGSPARAALPTFFYVQQAMGVVIIYNRNMRIKYPGVRP